MVLGPGINIQRDPRWGRNFEMFSEDPLLTSALGTADIEGIQSQDVMADVKHFVTYNQETNRDTPNDDTIVSTRALHEIYLPPFYSAIDAGPCRVGDVRVPVAERRLLVSEPQPAHRAAGRSVGLSRDSSAPTARPTPRPSIPPTPGSIRSAGASTGTTASSRRRLPTGR